MDENSVSENILENEKPTISSPSKVLRNSPESSTNFKQSKYKDDRYAQHKDLMNCIAFEKRDDSRKGNEVWNETRYSDDFDSLSSDTSDITDVSPQPLSPPLSSSGCSSMAKIEKELDVGKRNTERKISTREQANNKQTTSKAVRLSSSNENMKKEEGEQALKFLKDALNSLDCGSSVKTNSSSVGKPIFPRQRNMTFNREQMRTIDRENMILLRKIQCSRRRPIIENNTTMNNRISSSAINRQRQQRKIEFENSILLQKIQRVKGTTNTMTGLRRF